MKTLFFSLAFATALPVSNAANITPVEIQQTVRPQFPWNLAFRGTTEGRVRVALEVDENGKLVDALAIAYTRRGFGEEAIDAVRQWKYRPLKLDGEPRPAVTHIDFDFQSSGVVVNRTVDEMVEVYLNRNRSLEWALSPCPLRELDQIPQPIKVEMPPFPTDPKAAGNLGEVTVRFYIDSEGKVRMPHLVNYTDSAMASHALEAVRHWQFAPPTRDGNPVVVSASQRFTFVAK